MLTCRMIRCRGIKYTVERSRGNIVSQKWESVSRPDRFGTNNIRVICLPDTIDPRGPKGSGR
jgi:hypothetical protein